MNIIPQLSMFVKSAIPNESLSGLLKGKLTNVRKNGFVPENYYYLIHLINPALTFWSRKYKDTQKSNDILRKLNLGKRLERMASFWFRKLPDFLTEGGKLDGAFVGIPRVRGAMDFRIGENIIEFKTKDTLPESVNEIFQKYPQDLEQLAFYSVLDTSKSKKNYLVFMNNIPPYKLKVFKVITKDFGKIKTLLLERIKLLDEAFEKGDYSKLGQCRYYEQCRYMENSLCKCNELSPLPTNVLGDGLIVEYDEEFTQILQNEMGKSDVTKDLFTTFNIIAPRKCIMEKKRGVVSDYTPDVKKGGYLACLYNLIGKLSMNPSLTQRKTIKGMLKDDRVYIAQRWLNVPSSASKFGYELTPYTMRYSIIDTLEKARKPTQYALAELAIICAIYGKAKGLIFTVYPNLDDSVQVHDVVFKDPKEILRIIKERLDGLDECMKNGDILSVDACPDWMNYKGDCPLMKECHSKEGRGCIK